MYKTKKDFRPNTKKIYEEHHGVKVPNGYAVHHILPIRLGGTHDVSNLEVLDKECHIFAHLALYQKYGDVRDLCASYMLRGLTLEARKLAASKGGKAGNAAAKARGQVLGFGAQSLERRREVASKAGHVGGTKQRDLGIGIHVDNEQRAIWASMGGKVQSEANGWNDPIIQSENGKRGGVKNKGFKWCNDGIKEVKYTMAMQSVKSFEDFVTENNYIKGRTKK